MKKSCGEDMLVGSSRRYLTADIPPIAGGRGLIKQRPDDFLVDEVPAYQPSGEGEHIYLFVQKRGLSTHQLVALLARHFNVRESAIGYAGLKDRHAVTRQVVSIHTPGKTPEDFPSLRDDRVSVLWSDLHNNKLRRGHLKGNRFSIRVRNVALRDVFDAKRVLERLAAEGVPNRLGMQRFGMLGNNHLVGQALLLGRHDEALQLLLGPNDAVRDANQRRARELFTLGEYEQAADLIGSGVLTEQRLLRSLSRGESAERALSRLAGLPRSFYLSGFQSAVFNSVLDRRLAAGTLASLLPGDLAFKHDNGSVFRIDDAALHDAATTARLSTLDISPTGPLWGPSMIRAAGGVDEAEIAALTVMEVTTGDVDRAASLFPDEMEGRRRPLRVPLLYPEVEAGGDEHGTYLRCGFELPAGSFATVVMDEILKNEHADVTE